MASEPESSRESSIVQRPEGLRERGRGDRRSSGGRRRPASRLTRIRRRIRRGWRRTLDSAPLWISLFLIASVWSLMPRASRSGSTRLEVGAIAPRTVVADRSLTIADEVATANLQEEARQSVLPVFDLDRALEDRRRAQLADLFERGRAFREADAASGDRDPASTPADRLERLVESSRLRISAEQETLFYGLGYSTALEERLSEEIARLLRQGVVSDEDLLLEHRARGITIQELPSGVRRTELDLYRYLDYPEELREVLRRDVRLWSGIDASAGRTLVEFLIANLSPNLTPNNSETLELRRRAAAEVGVVTRTLPKGQVVVRKGDRVDAFAALALADLTGADGAEGRWIAAAGLALLLGALVFLVYLGLARDPSPDRPLRRRLGECLLLLTGFVLTLKFTFFVARAIGSTGLREPLGAVASYQWAIPFAGLAMITSLLYGRNGAFFVALVGSLIAGHFAGGDSAWALTVYCLAGSLAAIHAFERLLFKQRTVIATVGAWVGVVNVLTVLVLTLLGGSLPDAGRLGFDFVCAFAGGVLAAAITSFAVPVLEALFGVTTHIKLIELANPNLPLLRRLALEAPGTFQHSLAVANLSKAGCEAIDADAVLINTCALYHDIGKLIRPQYFIENQNPGQNPHDKIQPSMSALILIKHVKDGLDLAETHRLPAPIHQAIAQHHGTRLIKFFHRRALDQKDPDTEAVCEDDFRYPGPKPRSKEMGVLMLADAIEAASRTLVEPSRQKIRTMLRQIFDDCLADHQLDRTNLTLGELRRVEDAFLNVLTTIYHRRIDYPGFDFNQPRRKRSQSATGTVTLTGTSTLVDPERRAS